MRFPCSRDCALKVGGYGGAVFLGTAGAAPSLVENLFGPGWLWIIGATAISIVWAYLTYCVEEGDQK